ncbi:hypothetical protein [Streptomyces hoynatensis]|uniref:TPR repeat domain-containing protein n=1 Tax=Streptomyces hoynatensis TaxID=1141874 RepID=A0A3A9ZE05_9ACTN|nr:hypothetical protein [Streptomyces hoynatensis]RKN45586.1 hypothetical protein D7294_03655 [Streptomyces hoynatensis]
MSYRPFTKAEVEARAGKRPWETQRAFSAELDTEHMADIAARYARAAGEAESAGDLAEAATRASAGAGGRNGAPLVDENGRIDETYRGLRRGGTDIDRVVRHIVNGMNLAIDADKKALEHIRWLDWQYGRHLQAYAAEYEGWNSALETAVAARQDNPAASRVPLFVDYGNRSVAAEVSHGTPGTAVYWLPSSLYESIRATHLRNAADDANRACAEIDEEILAYRRRLSAEAAELAELGYELGEGPFTLFATPAMARFAATELRAELGKKTPDIELLELYTQGLASIAGGIYGDPVAGGDADRNLSPAELAYLDAFYGALDHTSLARLGQLTGLAPLTNAKRNVANGVMMMCNPDIGGYSPVLGNRQVDLPDSIGFFVQDYRESWQGRAFSPAFLKSVEMFNGFGGLMEEATVASGEEFSKSLAHAAVFSQEQLQEHTNLPNTGASGMLMAAALNRAASVELLSDGGFPGELLGLRWDDSRGVASLVENGTLPPDGLDEDSPEMEKYVHAAYNVLTYAADNPDGIRGILVTGEPSESHSHLERVIGDTIARHQDFISRAGSGSDTTPWDPGERHRINGTDYRYGFDLSSEDRNSLFSLMSNTPTDIRDNFFQNLSQWEYDTARSAFARGGGIGADLHGIGLIAGTAAHAQSSADTGELEGRLALANAAKLTFDFVGTLPWHDAIGPVTWPFKTGAEMYAGHVQEQISAAQDEELRGLKNWDRLPAKLLIADAARTAGAEDIDDPPDGRPGPTRNPARWTNLNQYANSVLGPNPYADDFENGFRIGADDATGAAAPAIPRVSESP